MHYFALKWPFVQVLEHRVQESGLPWSALVLSDFCGGAAAKGMELGARAWPKEARHRCWVYRGDWLFADPSKFVRFYLNITQNLAQ